MSNETMHDLQTLTLHGYGNEPWHRDVRYIIENGLEDNVYPGPVPVEDVIRRLFYWQAVALPMFVGVPGEDGIEYRHLADRQIIARNDTYDVLGAFKDGYVIHQPEQWLIENVANILDDDLGIRSAGWLPNACQAWVQVSTPETVTTPEGVEYMPFILASTSFNGSTATQYGAKDQLAVCDNTLALRLREQADRRLKVKHTKYSGLRIADAREAIGIIMQNADDFAAEVAELCSIVVTPEQWSKVLDLLVPMPTDGNKRGTTVADDKRARLDGMYRHDNRCAPWSGTAFGVVQTFNTYAHHEAQVRKGVPRGMRNMENVLSGKFDALDADVTAAVLTVVGA